MTEEQEAWLVSEVMDVLKMSESEESSARRYVRRAVDKILIYCNREDLPDLLLSTAAQIAEDMLKADMAVEAGKDVASISRGDTAISYRDDSKNQDYTVAFMKDYEKSLNRFKKINLPKDLKYD
ncbi:MAG: translation initiation factor 2 [Ruminococcus sp.]|nr:translation initiation factor 2 [Ruminococcus sp.]